jgi:hypothetical protein
LVARRLSAAREWAFRWVQVERYAEVPGYQKDERTPTGGHIIEPEPAAAEAVEPELAVPEVPAPTVLLPVLPVDDPEAVVWFLSRTMLLLMSQH